MPLFSVTNLGIKLTADITHVHSQHKHKNPWRRWCLISHKWTLLMSKNNQFTAKFRQLLFLLPIRITAWRRWRHIHCLCLLFCVLWCLRVARSACLVGWCTLNVRFIMGSIESSNGLHTWWFQQNHTHEQGRNQDDANGSHVDTKRMIYEIYPPLYGLYEIWFSVEKLFDTIRALYYCIEVLFACSVGTRGLNCYSWNRMGGRWVVPVDTVLVWNHLFLYLKVMGVLKWKFPVSGNGNWLASRNLHLLVVYAYVQFLFLTVRTRITTGVVVWKIHELLYINTKIIKAKADIS